VVWLKKSEGESAQPGTLDRIHADDPTLAEVSRYIDESVKAVDHTKAQMLRAIKGLDIANLRCSQIGRDGISALAQRLVRKIGPRRWQ
jgi:hypothetical protein